MGQRSWRVFYHVIWESGLEGILLPTNRAAAIQMERFSKLWTAITLGFIGISTCNLQGYFQMGLSTLCKSFVRKVVNLNFWWRHCQSSILGQQKKRSSPRKEHLNGEKLKSCPWSFCVKYPTYRYQWIFETKVHDIITIQFWLQYSYTPIFSTSQTGI